MVVDDSETSVSDDEDSAGDGTDLDDEKGGAAEEVEDDYDDDVDDPARRAAPGAPRATGRQRLVKAGLIAVLTVSTVIVIAVIVNLVLHGGGKGSASSGTNGTGSSSAATLRDAADHFQLNYPKGWAVQKKNLGPGVKLLTTFSPDGLDLMQVRVAPLAATVDTSNEADIKSVTDAIISGTNVTVLEQRALTVDGLLGYDYFYSFPSSGTTLIHSHVFIFPPHEMVEIVFQTTEADFAGAANNISFVLSSFKKV